MMYVRYGSKADEAKCVREAIERERQRTNAPREPVPYEAVFIPGRKPTYLNGWDGGKDRFRVSFELARVHPRTEQDA